MKTIIYIIVKLKIKMEEYLNLVDRILTKGKDKEDRTGTGTLALFGVELRHDMAKGFPLLTTKRMAKKTMWVELEGFINGVTDKKWYQDRNCQIWNEWCNPMIVPYGHDNETKERMLNERDLGPIYGFQWRHCGAKYKGFEHDYTGEGVDQLVKVVNTLKSDKSSRRMVVVALNPVDLPMKN